MTKSEIAELSLYANQRRRFRFARERRVKELTLKLLAYAKRLEAVYSIAAEKCRNERGPCWCGAHRSQVMKHD